MQPAFAPHFLSTVKLPACGIRCRAQAILQCHVQNVNAHYICSCGHHTYGCSTPQEPKAGHGVLD